MRLADLTTTEAAKSLEPVEVALLPTGAIEQHGPALPLSTDTVMPEIVAASIDREDVVQLPTIPIGVSEYHRQFYGTLWLDEPTFEAVVRETIASIASHGIQKAVLVNGHGGNSGANLRAARRLRNQQTAFVAPWNWWEADSYIDLQDELFDEEGGHADASESSIMLYLRESLVDRDALVDAEAGAKEAWGHNVAGASVGFDVIDYSDSGATGKPSMANVDAGRELVEVASEALEVLLDWLVDQEIENLWPKEHK